MKLGARLVFDEKGVFHRLSAHLPHKREEKD